jgi:arsenate reductase
MAAKARYDVTLYHNPACGTSRRALALIREAGIEPRVVEHLKAPPEADTLRARAARMGVPLEGLLAEKGTPFAGPGLGRAGTTEEAILAAITRHPILINRPVVATPKGARLCRPAELVRDLRP